MGVPLFHFTTNSTEREYQMNQLKTIFDIFEETTAFFDQFENTTFTPSGTIDLSHYPADISYDDTGLFIDLAAVGGAKDAFEIKTASDGLLTIKYEAPKAPADRKFILNKIVSKSFQTTLRIGSKFDLDKLEASYDNGILHIFVPVADSKKPKIVQIK